MNTRILTSVLTIVAVVAAVSAMTYAYFSDTGTSTNNIFSSGTLDLRLSNDGITYTENVTATWGQLDLIPGSVGGATLRMQNNGSISGYLDVADVTVANLENVRTAPELAAGDITDGAAEGELGANLLVTAFWDVNDNLVFDVGDQLIYGPGTLNGFVSALYNSNLSIAVGETRRIRINWELPPATTSVVQTDSATLDLTIQLDQTAD